MKESLFGPCGLYCGACGAADCGGCHSDVIDEYIEQCTFRRCADDKGMEFCCYCVDYPCSDLIEFMNDIWPHHWTIESNLEYIKEHGKHMWLKEQGKKWSCENCGADVMWYQKECPCGQKFDAWDPPE